MQIQANTCKFGSSFASIRCGVTIKWYMIHAAGKSVSSMRPLMKDGYKRVSIDGLPNQDGSYLVLLLLEEDRSQLCDRLTDADGSVTWISTDHNQIKEEDISVYKKVLISPEGLK